MRVLRLVWLLHPRGLVSRLRSGVLRISKLFRDSYPIHTFLSPLGSILYPMSETPETPTPETPAAPPTVETPAATAAPTAAPVAAVPAKSGKGKLAAIAGGAAVIGLIIGLGIGWLGFGDDHHDDRRNQPAMSQQGPGGRGQQSGGGQTQQGPGGQMMPGGRGQMGPQGSNGQTDPNAQDGTTQQSPQTQQGPGMPSGPQGGQSYGGRTRAS